MKPLNLLSSFVALICVLLCACSTTGTSSIPAQASQDSTSVPTGKWQSIYRLPMEGIKKLEARILMQITPEGKEFTDLTVVMELKPGQQFGTGKFQGLNRIEWTQRKHSAKVSRQGNKLFVYSDPQARARILKSSPPGYSANDFWTVGGVNPGGVNVFDSTGSGVAIYEIVGKDLILTNSSDRNRWLYKWAGH